MVNLTKLKEKAIRFVKEQECYYKGYEKGEKDSFWIDFMNIFNIDKNELEFEYQVKDRNNQTKFIDVIRKGNFLVEQKGKEKTNLDEALNQAQDYLNLLSNEDRVDYIIVCNFNKFMLKDIKTGKITKFNLAELPDYIEKFDFIYDYGKKSYPTQEQLTLDASKVLAKLHDELVSTNYVGKDLEIFLIRILFCLYAEDTEIFDEYQFYDYIEITNKNNTTIENLGQRIHTLFEILDQNKDERQTNLSDELKEFPYVNGSLFSESIKTPLFTKQMYDYLVEACNFEWNKINPSIFGSLFEYVMDKEVRHDFGAHYTSEENILKLINPLFMDNLKEEFDKALKKSSKRDKIYHLENLMKKMSDLKFFDPACGSGNFLIVAYRELRLLEYKILEEIHSLENNISEWKDKQTILMPDSITKIKIDNFYGIEIDEFSSKIAQVSMWFIEHQMNLKYESLGLHADNLPLKQYVNIKNENSLRIDWKDVVKPDNNVYILGNPPFIGKSNQSKKQKEDKKEVFKGFKNIGTFDYVTAWYKKALDYMENTEIESAFISTNSICQGQHVQKLWSQLRKKYTFYINFAHQSFKWSNEAKNNASVFCIIIGFSFKQRSKKFLYTYKKPTSKPEKQEVSQINSYLLELDEIIPQENKSPNSNLPKVMLGSILYDGGNLIIKTKEEKDELIRDDPRIGKYICKLINAGNYIKGKVRYCLWFYGQDEDSDYLKIPEIRKRINKVKEKRLKSTRDKTRKSANKPHLFGEIRLPDTDKYIFFPQTTTAKREYIPLDFIDSNIISNNSIFMISTDSKSIFGILISKMNMIWIKYISGKHKGDYRYSSYLYNTFPFPKIIEEKGGGESRRMC